MKFKRRYDPERIDYIKKLIKSEQLKKALDEIDDYIRKYPKDLEGRFQYANILSKIGKVPQALSIYNNLLNHDDKTKNHALYKLGMIAYNNNQLDLAQKYFKECIDTSPYPEALCHVGLSRIELKRNNIAKCFEILDHCKDQNDHNILFHKCIVLININKLEEAKQVVSLIKTKGDYELIRKVNIIKSNIESGQFNYYKSREYIEKALRKPINNDYWKAMLTFAYLESDFFNLEKSMELCQKIIDNNSAYVEKAKLLKADILSKQEKFDLAEKMYKQIIINGDDNLEKAQLHLGLLYFKQKKYIEAKKCFEKGITDYSIMNNAIHSLALTQYKLGLYTAADKTLSTIDEQNLLDITKNELKRLRILLDIKLDKKNKTIPTSYTQHQLVNYSKASAVKHIERIHEDKGRRSWFNPDIDISELLDLIPTLLPTAKLVDNDLFETYDVAYDEIGYEEGVITNKLEVVIEPETGNVITMYPKIGANQKEKQTIKRKSQIDKFYERYGKK